MRLNFISILLTIMLTLFTTHTLCGQNSSLKLENDFCHRIEIEEGNDELYAEYIDQFLLSEIKIKECMVDDKVMSLINDYSDLRKGNLDVNEFSRRQVKDSKDVHSIWYIDNLIVRDKPLYEKWIKKYKRSFSNCILDKIDNVEALKNDYTFEYFCLLLKKSDGAYAENISSRVINLFYEHPDFIITNISKLATIQKEVVSIFCYILPTKEQKKIRDIYIQYPSAKAEIVLNWLSCK